MRLARTPRAIRGLWPDRNPLRRAHDRVEAIVVGVLVVVFLASAPLAIVTAGRIAYSLSSRAAHAQRLASHRVPAVLLTDAPPSAYGSSTSNVQVRWAAPDGSSRTGVVLVHRGTSAGSTVMVWVDSAGRLTSHPLQRSQLWGLVVTASVLTLVVAGIILLCAGQLARYALDRRRLAAWDADWRATEPQWTGRR